ncbi:MAG: carboxypeptidase-like regulatory domain-containing protein, partial [Acidobacteriota bacterium]|nr:carboxypeptidase-like regulatory domain-containing protein [Acidobacteriota bacterium]
MMLLKRPSCIALLLFPFVAALLAQTNEGGISGNVVDDSGAVIVGAKVAVKSQGTGARQETTTTEGGYRFPSLPVGLYDLTVQREGFSSVTQTGVRVEVSSTASVNVTLRVGTSAQNVTVAADAETLKEDTSDIGTVVNTKQVIELPLALGGVGALRSPEAFTFLAPGTTGPGTSNSSNGVFISKVNGGQNFGNDILLDGASILRTENGSSFDEAAPSVEAIQEFKIFTSTFSAQYDRTTGGIDSFTTKAGTNRYHGTAYDIFRNTALDANSWFNSGYRAKCAPGDSACRTTFSTPPDKKNDYGLNLGGPVQIPKIYDGRNKTFFFFNWEQYKQTVGATYVSTVPTFAQRSGDFSQVLTNVQVGTNPCDGSAVFRGQIFDPATQKIGPTGVPCRAAFPGNVIPSSRFSQVAKTVLNYLPAPTSAGATQNYTHSDANPLANTVWTLRVDHSFSEKSRFFGMYSGRDNTRFTAAGRYYPAPADGNGWDQDFITHYARAGWDYTFTPTLLNHLNIGFNRTDSKNYTDSALQGLTTHTDWDAKLGIRGSSGINFPQFSLGEGIRTIGRTNNSDNIDNGWRFNENLLWVKGRHSLTIGADARPQLYARLGEGSQSGVFNFARSQSAASQSLASTSGNGFASFLLGTVDNANLYQTSHFPRWISAYYAAFVQDDFKVSSTLTLNLGIRYNLDLTRRESFNDTSNFSPTAPNPAAGNRPGALIFGTTCHCDTRWADTYKKAISPRFGFAWAPAALHSNTVVRGGYGIFYGPVQYTDSGSQTIQGYAATPNFFNSDSFTPAFALDAGFPAFAPPPLLNPSYVNGQNPYYVAPNYGRPSMTQSWSLQVQQKLSSNLVATVGYVAQRSTHLRSALLNINNISPASFALGDALNSSVTSATAQQAGVSAPYAGFTGNVSQALRPFPQYGRINTTVLENVGQSSYNSLQATLEQRFHSGFSLQASFTWEKTLTDADSLIPQTNAGVSQNQSPYNLNLDKALSIQDVPLTFTAAWIYELPFGSGKKWLNSRGVVSSALGGWQVGGVQRYQSGEPVSFGCATGIPGWDNCIRFNRGAGQPIYSASELNGTFDPFV